MVPTSPASVSERDAPLCLGDRSAARHPGDSHQLICRSRSPPALSIVCAAPPNWTNTCNAKKIAPLAGKEHCGALARGGGGGGRGGPLGASAPIEAAVDQNQLLTPKALLIARKSKEGAEGDGSRLGSRCVGLASMQEELVGGLGARGRHLFFSGRNCPVGIERLSQHLCLWPVPPPHPPPQHRFFSENPVQCLISA